MQNDRNLHTIKIIHTAIWIFYNIILGYMLYAALFGTIGTWFWICFGLVIVEGIVLLIFRWTCPLSILARKYTNSRKDNFDIYLPNWLAKHTKTIYTTLAVLITVIAAYRLLSHNY